MTDPNRRTGRTTKMLETVLLEARQGKEVIIYCMYISEIAHQLRILKKLESNLKYTGNSKDGKPIKLGNGTITFRRINPHTFDKVTLRDRGISPKTITLLDHYTLEMLYEKEIRK